MSEVFERELRRIFEGDHDVIARVSRPLCDEDSRAYELFFDYPFLVSRGAGSMGIDLLAIRGKIVLPIEVKSTKHEQIYFNKREVEQLKVYKETAISCNIPVLYALRRKGGKKGERWAFFAVDGVRPPDIFLPVLPLSRNGNEMMRFSDGMLLSEMIRSFYMAGFL